MNRLKVSEWLKRCNDKSVKKIYIDVWRANNLFVKKTMYFRRFGPDPANILADIRNCLSAVHVLESFDA